MTKLTTVQLKAPYLILIGDITDADYAKTGLGIVQWQPELVAGQLRFAGCEVELGVPDMSVAEAVKAGVRSLIIGVAPIGGEVPHSWWASIEEAARAGLDIVCGLHIKLADFPAVVAAARASIIIAWAIAETDPRPARRLWAWWHNAQCTMDDRPNLLLASSRRSPSVFGGTSHGRGSAEVNSRVPDSSSRT